MNIKPGDIAMIKGAPNYNGCIVDVIDYSPTNTFILPDGHKHGPAKPGSYIVKAENMEFTAPTNLGSRKTRYGSVHGKYLMPIGKKQTQKIEISEKEI